MNSETITHAYAAIRDKPELQGFLVASRLSRKLGFPLIATHGEDVSLSKKISFAAALIFGVAGESYEIGVLDELELDQNSLLYQDAMLLVNQGVGNFDLVKKTLKNNSPKPSRMTAKLAFAFVLGMVCAIAGSVLLFLGYFIELVFKY